MIPKRLPKCISCELPLIQATLTLQIETNPGSGYYEYEKYVGYWCDECETYTGQRKTERIEEKRRMELNDKE